MQVVKSLNIDCALIKLLDNGIVTLNYKPNYTVELNDIKEVEKNLISLTNNGNIFCMMDTSGRFNHYTKEAQKYMAHDAQIVQLGKIKCSAIVIDNLPNRLLARFFSNFYKPTLKVKLFSKQEGALAWLQSEIATQEVLEITEKDHKKE